MTTVANLVLKNNLALACIRHTRNKDITARQYKIDIFIESSASDARRMAEICKTIILDSPYNRFGAGPDVIRAYSWQEVLGIINGQNKSTQY